MPSMRQVVGISSGSEDGMQRSRIRIAQSVVIMAGVIALGCTASADKAPTPTKAAAPTASKPTPAAQGALSPDARGRAVLNAQLAALANDDAFLETFAKQATVLTPLGSTEVHAPNARVAGAIAFLNPHAEVKSATFDHFTAGGNAHVAWFSAELHLTLSSHEPGGPAASETHTVRAIELLDAAADWKVAVAAFTNVAPLNTFGTSTIKDPTDAGPLTSLLLSPPALTGALGEGAVVFGTDPGERAIGAADATALLAKWKKLTITLDPKSKVREVHAAAYGYAVTNVRIATKPGGEMYKLSAFVLALPGAKPDSWSVVGVSYGALF
jgi:hypothetical protein